MGAVARILLAFLCVAFAATGVTAQTTAYAVGDGTPNSLTLNIPVTASVRPPCGFTTAPSGSHDEPNFDDHAWQHDFSFVIDCSVASRLAVVSTNGGLKTSGTAAAGYTTLGPYNVTLNVVPDGGGGPVTANCAAVDLTTGGNCTFRGPAAPGQGLNVPVTHNQAGSYVRVSAPAYTGTDVLVASTGYADTLVVTLSPAT
jgi:hypothetical protein